MQGGAVCQGHRGFEFVEQDPEDVGDTHGTGGGEAVQDRASDHDCVRTTGEGFENVRPAADTAIHENRDRASDFHGDGGQGVDGGRGGVERAAAMIGSDDAGNALVDRDARVLR